ncbi:Mov34/MPN/PAD-1 family protein [Catenovulum adriaticum]|uniref:Mov34/MPN/PAD-1 family protein n=1 Tax=Catenovulum adriaticum TaxID=2984846 RepID=A0ABY7AIW4_9ALTE|nr:Mov34/MPN/PAD-1 family protein [Catenovulum sp. TS8]WAJ69532.1 Mov34/MPN/PAD-1 family protein [Catenovulum sp. TS8]
MFVNELILQANIEVKTNDKVSSMWKSYRQTGSRREACGFIIGGYEASNNLIIVDQCTTPGIKDIRTRYTYKLKDPKHHAAVVNAYNSSGGYSNFLGVWHTHPERIPSPSDIDINGWNHLIKENDSIIPAFLFVIVGTEKTNFYTYLNERFNG